MTARHPRVTPIERELAALEAAVATDQSSAVRHALRSTHARVLARAAEIARARSIDGLTPDLAEAFGKLVPRGAEGDPGCRAKLALLDALDALGWLDEESFLAATRMVQNEKAWGPPVDTATGVRARGVLALMRQGCRDLPLIAAEMLDDPQAPVRAAAADALGAHRSRDAAGALIAKLGRGDDDPTVTVACFAACLALVPEWTIPMLRRGHCGSRPVDRELASIALGTSRRDDALDLLIAWLSSAARASERETMLTAIGLHRTERALAVLLERVTSGPEADALAAIQGLRARRFDAGVLARARAAAQSRSEKVQRVLEEQLAQELASDARE